HAKMLRERRAQQQATLPKKRALHSVQKNTAKPGGSYKRKMRDSRATRSQPKPVMPPSPPIALPRSDIGGTSGSTAPADDNASFDLFAESGDEEARSATPKQPVKTKTSPGAAVAVGNENHTVVKVYFATDRQRTASTKLASLFGGQPSDPKRISYGICEVSIPKGHKPGALETPSIWRFEFKENPDKHVVLLKVHPQEKKSYFHNLKSIISRSKGQNAFIFIHGYNVTFTDAARRTAQITYDLGFDGAPVFYSWPSTGELGGYPTDEENVAWAQENVKQFLKDFVEQTDAKNIYLVAHSMGSRALTGAVSSLVVEAPQFKKRFKEIILAAPDISARIFKDNIAPKMIQASNNITLYVSSDDKALLASRKFHANPRAGEAGENIIIFKGIDTIDATGIDASLLAHSYFAEAKSIISDILAILKGEPPSGRKTLKPINTKHGIYWAFTK
ncbi:MAG: alpha/beta fold hydrolase, partial [bacterium]|nr:alpha/beta fold hydrolase [bacterium]